MAQIDRCSATTAHAGELARLGWWRGLRAPILGRLVFGSCRCTVLAMSLHVVPGNAPAIVYAGRPMEVLAGLGGDPAGFAVAELTVPTGFAGPPPHVHDVFDEGIYVLEGSLLVVGDGKPTEAGPGSLFLAPRGDRHAFSNPFGEPARVLGLWAPSAAAMAFMAAVGAVLPAEGAPDVEALRSVYEAHGSHLVP